MSELRNQVIVIDTSGSIIVLGRLMKIASDCLVLQDADVHDCQEGYSSKELYVINALKYGIRPNRKKVYIPKSTVTAVSAIEDFIID